MALEIAICMATYRPDLTRLRAQLASIELQTFQSWHCWVVDDGSGPEIRDAVRQLTDEDSRFTFVAHLDNVGHYRNFERALAHVPEQTSWVALCDQDDVWAPDKLAVLLAAARQDPATTLVYSDVEVRDSRDAVVSPTYWVGREHNEDDLSALLFANTVTGAAALVRSDVVRLALPFPNAYPSSFHDHWLALLARVTGTVRYVPVALHAYVQHGTNAIGHQAGGHDDLSSLVRRHALRRWWVRPAERYFDDEVARLADLASTLLDRVPTAPGADRRVLRAVASLHGPRPCLAWLAGQAVREARDPSVTMWRRRRVLASVAYSVLFDALHRTGSTP